MKATGTDKFCLRECHGIMPHTVHEVIHRTTGTFRRSGGGVVVGTYTLQSANNSDIKPSFSEMVIFDEDLITTVGQLDNTESPYTLARITTGQAIEFLKDETYPFKPNGTNQYISINNPAAGTNSQGINNRYVNVYQITLPCGSDVDSQSYRMIFLQPQVQYTSLAAAQAENINQVSLGNLSVLTPEFVIHARLTYYLQSGYTTVGKCRLESVSYVEGTRSSLINVVAQTNSAENIIFIPTGSISSTNVQDALAELDLEKLALTGGTLTGQLNISYATASGDG